MSAPFNRATKLFNAIKLIIDANMPVELQRLALNGLPAYRSRGHGRNAPAKNYITKASKYTPHQGERECARRRVQLGIDRRAS